MGKSGISFDSQSLLINGKRVILIGGEFHYFRTPRELWEDRLAKIRQSGCNLIATYIPWNFHEEKEGVLNWEGDRDLPAFLELCEKYGLYVIIKPGPYICAEWDFGGFPHWLLEKDIPLRVPDEKYLALVKKWFDEVARVIKPHLITNGGNIILIQVENEYDHLIEETGIVDSKETARKYLLRLLQYAREAGIDVPAFTNEGSCILGTEIINTHTYYPNIPWIWMWEFNDFDRKIEESRKVQTDKPLMIMELEAGWFAQYGKPLYEVETECTEAITKTVLAYGASVINYYMMAGGTSFPYWPAKGDYGGTGICNTFDFGIAPVREWGEIHEKFHYVRKHAYFLNSFPGIITEGRSSYEGAEFIKGGEEIVRAFRNKQERSSSFKNSFENVKIMQRRWDTGAVLLVRNLEDEKKEVMIGFESKITRQKLMFPEKGMKLGPFTSLLLPIDFQISKDICIVYSTSELILKKNIGKETYVILKNNKGIRTASGEMVLHAAGRIQPVQGKIKTRRSSSPFQKITYAHSKTTIFRIKDYHFIILPEEEAKKLWVDDDLIMISDLYFLCGLGRKGREISLDILEKKSSLHQSFLVWHKKSIRQAFTDSIKLKVKKGPDKSSLFTVPSVTKTPNRAGWEGAWKYSPDNREKEIKYNDAAWPEIAPDTPLEKARFFRHGYFWYRSRFVLPSGFKKVSVKLNSNEMDRFTVYINGKFRWIGIASPDLEITSLVHPGENILAICYENAFHTKAHPHEGPIKKYSGMYFPVQFTIKGASADEVRQIKSWKVRDGLSGVNCKWSAPEFDDSSWQTLPEGKKFVFQEDLGNLIWLRRPFFLKKDKNWEAPFYIRIRTCKDRCLIHINGHLIGKYEDIGPQRDFYIPENMLGEKNLAALLIEGPGFHPVKQFGFLPPRFEEPELGFFHQAGRKRILLKF